MAHQQPAMPVQQVVVQQAPDNGLGTAGFVVALIGFLTCGLISPIGLLLSFFGLFKPPRGLALAGTILGLIGSWWLIFFGLAILGGIIGIGAAVDSAANQARHAAEMRDTTSDQPVITPPAHDEETLIPLDEQPPQPTTQNLSDSPSPEQPNTTTTVAPSSPTSARDKESEPAAEYEPTEADFRSWTDSTGKFSIEAAFIGFHKGMVVLRKRDGTDIEISPMKLSKDDVTWYHNEMLRRKRSGD